MSEANVELLRSVYAQTARGDFTVYSLLPDDLELVIAPQMPDAGTYRGEHARRWLRAWVDSFDGLKLKAVELTDAGERVLTEFVQRGSPRNSDAPIALRSWAVTTFQEGALKRIELFMARGEALEAAGLSE